ncbi:MAG: hypothetical protein LBF27_23700 [Sphingobacterium sp.]|jgi:hypothetical protein|nr:hypothetical protein [Sphingobacterium sp.]
MRDNLKDFVNANRDGFDHREPSADLWNKIKPQIVPPVEEKTAEKKIRPLWQWMSIAAAILMIGVAALVIFNQQEGNNDVTRRVADLGSDSVKKEPAEIAAPSQQDLAVEIEKKEPLRSIQTVTGVQKTRVVASKSIAKIAKDEKIGSEKSDYIQMLQDSIWASTRLAAVLGLQKQGNLDENATEALEKIAVSDESSNVRMAAIETLLDGMSPEVKQQKVQDFFVAQNDPTLQMELMQMMAQKDESGMKNSTKDKLNAIVEDPLALKFVKEQAYAVLLQQ